MMDIDIALKRQLGVLPNLYNAVFRYVLWVMCDVTQGDFRNRLGNGAAKRLKVPPCLRRSGYAQAGVKVLQHTELPHGTFFLHLVYCLRKDFTQNVIPDLIKPASYLIRGNPLFSAGFPFPDQVEDKFHGNDNPYYHCKEVLETVH